MTQIFFTFFYIMYITLDLSGTTVLANSLEENVYNVTNWHLALLDYL